MMVAMVKHEDDGKFLPLSRVARSVFIAARDAADAEGWLEERDDIAATLGLQARTLRMWFAHLETRRFNHRALVKRVGRQRLWVHLGDMPGIPRRPRQESAATIATAYDAIGRRISVDPKLRAQLGGLTRAMNEAIAKRKAAEAATEAIEQRLYSDRNDEAKLGTSAELVAYRADLEHALTCHLAYCPQCDAAKERLGVGRERYAKATEIADVLDQHRALVKAVDDLLVTMRDQGVGAAARRMEARSRVAAIVEGSR